EKSTYADIPARFEAGTPDIAGVIGLAAALDFLDSLGWDQIESAERALLESATRRLIEYPGLRLIGTPKHRSGVVSFVLDSVHPHDIGTILDQAGVAVRTGHHCAQPVMDFYRIPATTRASFAIYNQQSDIEALLLGLDSVRKVFRL
ncbi:MAG: aminotransferase class V-fold PLP-dependent enzyme, partial [Bdellovibrionota bacterium]